MAKRSNRRAEVIRDLRDTIRLLRDPTLAGWALYVLLVPVYVISSGLPQPGDWMILILAPLALRRWNGRLRPAETSALRALTVFTGYVVLVNVGWSLVLNAWHINLKQGLILSAAFYVYNGLVFLLVLVMYRRYGERLLWFTAKIILGTLILQGAISIISTRGGLRASVLFNNPNQLGYYALCSVSLLLLLQRRAYASTLEVTIGTIAASYLALISASKAALGAIGLLVIAGAIVRFRTMILIAVVFMLTLYVSNPLQSAIDRTLTRFDTDTSLGFLEERGYDRIWNNQEYWVVGAGEGAYNRFAKTTMIGAHEIHSSVGTLFFSYGIVGVVLFGVFVWLVMRRTGLRTWLLVMPAFAYGMTHQGLRFTLFWVLLAVVVVMREDKKPALASPQDPRDGVGHRPGGVTPVM